MADKTCSLLEFVGFCMEKNEVLGGWSFRWCPYRTPELAQKQYGRLVDEGRRLLGEPDREVKHGLYWEKGLVVRMLGTAVMVHVAAPIDGPAWTWGDSDPDWDHCQNELTALFETDPGALNDE